MRRFIGLMGALALSAWAWGQGMPAGGSYSKMKIEKVGQFSGTFGGSFRIQKMTGGVSVRLLSDDPAQNDLPIRAQTMTVDWPEGAPQPKVLTLEGNVRIDHPQATVSSQKAEWNFETGLLVFTGSPTMDSERAKGLHASKITLNFKTNNLEASDLSVEEVPLNAGGMGGGESADPNLLSESDVSNWAGLIEAIKADLKKEGANPGKQLVSKLDTEAQGGLQSLSTEMLVQNKAGLLKKINKVLAAPGLYSKAAWAGATLGEEVKALLAKTGLTPAEQIHQNRLLLESAYPALIAKR